MRVLVLYDYRPSLAGLATQRNLLPRSPTPQGEAWQRGSAALYLYACACVQERTTPVFDHV